MLYPFLFVPQHSSPPEPSLSCATCKHVLKTLYKGKTYCDEKEDGKNKKNKKNTQKNASLSLSLSKKVKFHFWKNFT
jgi:hypothetical protein